MSPDDLKTALVAVGFKTFSALRLSSGVNRVDWAAARRVSGVPDCNCNDKPPQIVVTPHEYFLHGREWFSVEVDLTAESASGQWFKLLAYSLKPEDLMANLDAIEGRLAAAWRAVNA